MPRLPALLAQTGLLFLLATLIGCQPETPEDAPASLLEFGAPVRTAEAVPAPAVATEAQAYVNRTVTVDGRITEVCQKKGCWWTLDTGDRPIRVHVARTEGGDYAFTIPKDLSGAHATVTGTLKQVTLDGATQQHYADDAQSGGAAELPPANELQITAEGVVIERAQPNT
jgi:hypothetical protein